MRYGICNLSLIPLRQSPSDSSELVSQILYGEIFKVLEWRKSWSKVRLDFDSYEGWVATNQYKEVSSRVFSSLQTQPLQLSLDLVEFVQDAQGLLQPVVMGSTLNGLSFLEHTFEGQQQQQHASKKNLIPTAFRYLKSPYLWGGKSPFGMDCSGFTQMVYKLNGFKLLRDASQQVTQGRALSFIEESEPGDLAFFDNNEGDIVHVGIIMENNYIIHAHGQVRIDRLDHTGIYNVSQKRHTHALRVIKQIV